MSAGKLPEGGLKLICKTSHHGAQVEHPPEIMMSITMAIYPGLKQVI